MKKTLTLAFLCLAFSLAGFAQTSTTTPAPTPAPFIAFATSNVTFNVSGGSGFGANSIAGMETDSLLNITPSNMIGPTTFTGNANPFLGVKYEYACVRCAKWIHNHTSFNGASFQPYATLSVGEVKGPNKAGARFGFGLNYAPAGQTTYGVGLEAQVNYLEGIETGSTKKWYPTVFASPVLVHW
jgi:hypothetical protein